ncbi:MAG: 3-oxoacyl-[acyl-carrier-protein] reductase [Eubacteriales bacterium]|jgi:3-oxoacyl-[acyl-carrier protein] reductase|nr:3-oxoacyl-[acyl-carrier-protein] reductase [Eubacteriales bacterium]
MTALITGASRGIGRAIALEFAKSGYNVAINYANSEVSAKDTAKECGEFGVLAFAYKADVSDFDACKEMVAKVEQDLGPVEVLVNNAGINIDNLLIRMSQEQFDKVYFANLKSVYNMSRQVVPGMMKRRRGRIINISSVAGLYGNVGQTNYAATKAGIVGFTKSLAKEVGARGITVNAIAPGFIETDMTDRLSDNIKEIARSKITLGRFGKAEDIAKAAMFLASDGASYITGHTLEVSGGISL